MTKINSVEICGIRGIKNTLPINLAPAKSILIFGDNGSGKSSITDAIEWFYYDKVGHLSIEEIGRNGIEALRNTFLPYENGSYIEIKYSDSKLNCKKEISYKKPSQRLISKVSNSTDDYNQYIAISQNEKLILRYRDLGEFIVKTKTEKLQAISEIIGFEEVTNYKSVLRKAISDLNKVIKIKDFDTQISSKKAQLLEYLNQQVHNDGQYFKAIQDLIAPLKLGITIKEHKDIIAAIELIKQPENKENIALQLSYDKLIADLDGIIKSFDSISDSYKECVKEYLSISKDAEKFKNISLERLLSEGLRILEKGYFTDDKCPMCLQNISREELINDLRSRIAELEVLKTEKEKLLDKISIVSGRITKHIASLETGLNEKSLFVKKESKIKIEISAIKDNFDVASKTLNDISSFTITRKITDSFPVDKTKIQSIIDALKKERAESGIDKKDDIKSSIHIKLELAKERYKEIRPLEKEAEIIKDQVETMETIYAEYIKKQREGINLFLSGISENINELYCYMNPTEKVDKVCLIPLGEKDELDGITIQFEFHGKIVSPPNRYLSESHLNCLGIALFLSSVKTYNKRNQFIILDDVISSFDRNHRLRFARLLSEKFSNYQIFLFTHERDWFEYVASAVKGKNWFITEVTWDYENGVDLRTPLVDLKERIDAKIKALDCSELGNMLRIYLEHILKEICLNLKVKLGFLYNDANENRMSNEMLSELKCKLEDANCDLKNITAIGRLINSVFLGNKTSHDSKYQENISDLTVFYDDIKELQKAFYCDEDTCKTCISIKYYDTAKKEIRCKCGKMAHSWKL